MKVVGVHGLAVPKLAMVEHDHECGSQPLVQKIMVQRVRRLSHKVVTHMVVKRVNKMIMRKVGRIIMG